MQFGKFNQKAKSYETYADIQKQVAFNLFSFLQSNGGDLGLVLDLGAGSGFLNKFLQNYEVISIDIAYNFLKLNQNNNKINANALKMPFKKSVFNTIISSSAVQWIEDFEQLLENIDYVLCENGILCFSAFLKGTFSEMETISKITGFGNILEMKDINYYETILKKHNYEMIFISEDKDTIFFDSVKKFLISHKMTGASVSPKKVVGKRSYYDFIKYYNNFFAIKGQVPVSYNVGYFVCRKKQS